MLFFIIFIPYQKTWHLKLQLKIKAEGFSNNFEIVYAKDFQEI